MTCISQELVGVYILAKNEEANIGRCLKNLVDRFSFVQVLDSGSNDSTSEIVASFSSIRSVNYAYTNHCDAYNHITSNLGLSHKFVIILDSDMIINTDLFTDISDFIKDSKSNNRHNVYSARVEMWIDGFQLRKASLYPPKPIMFRTGKKYFESLGHGEKIISTEPIKLLKSMIIHDDRKPYKYFLLSQDRYSINLVEREKSGNISARDKVRTKLPIFIFITPIFSLIFKMGILDGKAGLLYALDRLIAEAIMYRNSISSRLHLKALNGKQAK